MTTLTENSALVNSSHKDFFSPLSAAPSTLDGTGITDDTTNVNKMVNTATDTLDELIRYARSTFQPGAIPIDLRDTPRWIDWSYRAMNGELKKPPVDSRGYPVSHLEIKNFQSFDRSFQRFQSEPRVAGIGFVLARTDNICAVDLDHCLIDGHLTEFARSVISAVKSYTEISPSGQGIRILCLAPAIPSLVTEQIEIYASSRYVTVTGRRLARLPTTLMDRTTEIGALVAAHRPPVADGPREGVTVVCSGSDDPPRASDDTVWRRMMNSTRGPALRKILADGTDEATDQPKNFQFTGEMRVISSLVFFAGGHRAQVRRILLSSRCERLHREKWRDLRAGTNFLDYEINRAVQFNIQRGYLK